MEYIYGKHGFEHKFSHPRRINDPKGDLRGKGQSYIGVHDAEGQLHTRDLLDNNDLKGTIRGLLDDNAFMFAAPSKPPMPS